MSKVVEVQTKLSVFFRANDLPKLIDETWAAVRREAHHLAFVAVMRKAEKLGCRCVDDADRMRILDLSEYLDLVAVARGPHGRNKVAETIDRQQRRILEWGNVETARQMRAMMLDVVKLRADPAFRYVEDAG